MHFRPVHGALIVLSLTACAQRRVPVAMTMADEGGACAGQTASFTLQKLPNPSDPQLPKLTFPPHTSFAFSPVSPDARNTMQLNVCVVDDSDFRVQTIKYMYFGRTMTLTVGADTIATGVQEALFGDASKLYLRIPTHSAIASNGAFYLLKWFGSSGNGYVAATETFLREGADFPTDERVMIGDFQPGSAIFPDQGPCAGGEAYGEERFNVGTASFFAKLCSWPTADRSTAYRLLEVTVHDANPHAPPGFTATLSQRSDFDGDDAPCRYHWTHHNMNDSFTCKTAAGTYGTKVSGFFGNLHTNNKVVYADGTTENTVKRCESIFGCLL